MSQWGADEVTGKESRPIDTQLEEKRDLNGSRIYTKPILFDLIY